MTVDVDVLVVGGGIAGISAAYHLADLRTVLVEAAPQLAFHSTGRSAALFTENYGAPDVRPLTRASRRFLVDPPPGLVDGPLVGARGVLWVARTGHDGSLDLIEQEGRAAGSDGHRLTPAEAVAHVTVLKSDRLAGALLETRPMDIDVARLHQAFVRGFRRAGGTILTSSPVVEVTRTGRGWSVTAGSHHIAATAIVNAGGAWGDEVAALAGVAPVGLVPKRRTAFMVPGRTEWAKWPMVIDSRHQFYFKPDGPQLLCSPADETPAEPGDARPDPLDVAQAIERINEVTDLAIHTVRSEWAGLRTFAPDGSMVIGPDPSEPSFHWLVGQGGTGIQTAFAAGSLAASRVRGEPMEPELADAGVDPEALSVTRLR